MNQKDWMGKNGFIWFTGIIQDIDDPLNCGRARVRCFGWHSSDFNELPVSALPWAQVMMPVTSASTSSIGRSGTGLLKGSFVIGFFMDGDQAMQPIIMGSLHGIPERETNAFSDPDRVYPTDPGYPDTPNLAYNQFINDKITTDKEAGMVIDIPTASKYELESVTKNDGEEEYFNYTWSEPYPRNGKDPVYPKNHVTQTESGHAIEIDDTPENERIHVYHRTGTFSEIQDTGDRVTKIVGDDFEICVKNKNVFINGECNITITGNARLRFDKDLIQEVLGDYNLMVHGNMLTKINGNDVKEVICDRSEQINGDETRRITRNRVLIVGENLSENIELERRITIGEDMTQTVVRGDSNFTTKGTTTIVSSGKMDIGTGETLDIASASTMDLKAGGNMTAIAPRIDLN